ncbi:MAG: hypothetical protein ACOCQA_00100 [bacterium]
MKKRQIRLHIDENDKEYYDKLEEDNILSGKNRDKFLFAMAYGYENDACLELKSRDSGGYWRFYESDLIDRALVFSVALDYKSDFHFNSKDDLKEILLIAEKYAHGGIKLIFNLRNSVQLGSMWKKIEKKLYKKFQTSIAIDSD